MRELEELIAVLEVYMPGEQLDLVRRAYEFAAEAHQHQKRSTGEPYITHPLSVALILAQMNMDVQSIVSAILHDVIEDTKYSKDDIESNFGAKVAELVDGVSKLAQIKFESKAEAQAGNLRKMMLAMAKDIRVILVKLADRLHNMRTLEALVRDKQRRIALETLEVYAPIANRLGMNNIKVEFEDLGFRYLYPVRYKVLQDAVRKARGNRKELIANIEKSLKSCIEQDKVSVIELYGREKHLYSLYKKMRNKDLSLYEVMDVYALRIIVSDVDSCYRILGIVHNHYKPVHGRFKDYIAVPKANGYQSLHTVLLGPHGIPIEIQIRTQDMEYLAEKGIAAHWLYKDKESSGVDAASRARDWLKGLLEIQQNTGNSLEFIEQVKVDLYPDEVYVFTPSGDILSLPSGSSAVDFAYAVHTDVGNSCIAVKIDRRLVPLSSRLSSGQTVEVITADGAHPNPAWLSFVVTGKARSNIRNWLKTRQKDESMSLGKRLIDRALSSLSVEMKDIKEEKKSALLEELGLNCIDRLYEEVGLGNQMAPIIARRLSADGNDLNETLSIGPLAIRGTEGMVVSYAKCCRPIPGDSILGFLSSGRGMVIHRENCRNVGEVRRNPEKYVFVQWDNNVEGEFLVELRVDVLNKKGVLATIANALSDCDANIENVYVDERDPHHNTLVFLINVADRKHLARTFRRVRSISLVTRVSRAR